ncbi:MAG: hypothetical protein V3V08_05655 [Nannocystaceae bacterium]
MPFSDAKAREWLEDLRGLHIADRPEYARTVPNMSAFEDQLLEAGCPTGEIEDLIQELEYYRGGTTPEPDPSIRLMAILAASVVVPAENSTVVETTEIKIQHKPRFPTMLPALDLLTRGGGYGLTTVGADSKAGKTMFLVGTAVESAKAGWRVVYLNAELDRNEIIMAVMRYCGGIIPDAVKSNLSIVLPDVSFQPADAIKRVQEAVQPGDSRILILPDSINALVDLSSDGQGSVMDYWTANSLWRNWSVRATRQSQGRLAFCLASETNKEGRIKGRQLEFKSDLVVRIKKDPESVDGVSIDVTDSRSTRAGWLGDYLRNWEKGRFDLCT